MKQQTNLMETKPVLPLLLSMAFPPMISMLIQSMYNIIDSIFVARLGQNALTAVSLVYPLQNLSLAVAVGLGVGLNACVARSLGEKNQKKAQEAVSHGFLLAALHGVLFIFVGVFLSRPFLAMFTSDKEILDMAVTYSTIVISLTFASHFHIAIEKIFQSTGNMLVPMLLQGIGALANIILDPIFIFGLMGFPKMGVAGAAIATILGQMLACLLAFLLMQTQKEGLKFHLRKFPLRRKMISNIYQVAFPSAVMTAMPSLLVSILNGILSQMANAATGIAVLGLYFKMQSFVYMPANGVIQALRPIASYNYGANRKDRLKAAVNTAMLITAVIMAAGTLLFAGIPEMIMKLFNADPQLMAMGTQALRIISISFFLSTPALIYSGTFEALGKGLHSLSISILRQMSILPVLAYFLSKLIGITGVWIAFPIAETIALIFSLILWKKYCQQKGLSCKSDF